jgi:hypothetical protein
MTPFPQLLADLLELCPHSRLRGVTVQQKPPCPRLPADVREAEELEDLRPPFPAFTTSRLGEPPEAAHFGIGTPSYWVLRAEL